MLDILNTFKTFFERNPDGRPSYRDIVEKMLDTDDRRLIINISDVGPLGNNAQTEILRHPVQYVEMLENEVNKHARNKNTKFSQSALTASFHIGFTGAFGSNVVSPRDLNTTLLNQMVCLEGIVTKTSLVRPKILRSVHYCPAGQHKYYYKDYVDMLSASENVAPTSSAIPLTNPTQDALEFEFGYSSYVNVQTITVQEMPERAPFGQLPRSVDIMLDHDLVDHVKPGDRVRVFGVFKAIAPSASLLGGSFRTIITANNIEVINANTEGLVIDSKTISQMRNLARNKNVFDILAASVAPSIRGHELIKKALVLQMIGGKEHNLDNGIHLRGDINILLVGDPSCGKSQLLRFVLNTMPIAVNTTGRGSSGVGLTAAVVKDQETGERKLEAGAMVLADKGIVCIDEFDKMSEADRVAIHEVMEQQTVTIAKAGIHCSLNARCSVLAAANPVYGQYDVTKRPQENVGLPDSLLSRFDLLFIVRDEIDPEKDRDIASHVLQMHRYVRPGHENLPEAGGEEDEEEKVDNGEMYVKGSERKKKGQMPQLTTTFLRKYLDFAKSKNTELTDEAIKYLVAEYAELRQKSDNRTLPITARLLETMIRLSTAHAKLRLSAKVELSDCKVAMELVNFALYHDAQPQKVEKKKPVEEKEVTFSDEEEVQSKKVKVNEPEAEPQAEREMGPEEEEMEMEVEETAKEVSEEVYSAVRGAVSKLYVSTRSDVLTEEEIEKELNKQFKLEKPEIAFCLSRMVDDNQILKDGNNYYRI